MAKNKRKQSKKKKSYKQFKHVAKYEEPIKLAKGMIDIFFMIIFISLVMMILGLLKKITIKFLKLIPQEMRNVYFQCNNLRMINLKN